ncbi:MAG: CoA transferase subunit A, partial [Proteobacteria bacterium]|nr:CoA transferase subunit A [Pseudomonadota bacterium]
NKPMALIREIIRKGVRDLIVIAVPQASIDVDMLIGAGCVAEVRVPYLGFEYLGLAPCFRAKAGAGELRVWECDETLLLAGLEAATKSMPTGFAKAGVGTDIPKLNPDLKVIEDPFTKEPIIAVAAMRPNLAILHAAQGDRYGNLRYTGYPFADAFLAEATVQGGGRVVASVDEIVSNASFVADPFRTGVSAMLVDCIVHAPYGAYPCSSHGSYQYDEAALMAYLSAAGTEAGLRAYLDDHVATALTQTEYLDKHVKPSALCAARMAIHD